MNNSTLVGTDIISREEAKLRIVRLLIKRKKLDYLDIVIILKLDLRLVIDLCKELIKEGSRELVDRQNCPNCGWGEEIIRPVVVKAVIYQYRCENCGHIYGVEKGAGIK